MTKPKSPRKTGGQIASPPEFKLPPSALPYASGYAKPPEHTKFVKGKSGNPKGRPRKLRQIVLAENIVERLHREYCATAVINGKETLISGFEACCLSLYKVATSSDPKIAMKAIATLFEQERLLTQEWIIELGMNPKTVMRPPSQKDRGGLLYVPAQLGHVAWQKEAMAQQAQLIRDLRDPNHGVVTT